jgi:hypothetical protein
VAVSLQHALADLHGISRFGGVVKRSEAREARREERDR